MNEEDLKWRPCGACGEKTIPRGVEWPYWVEGKCVCDSCWWKQATASTSPPRHDFDGPRFDHKIERDTVRENLDLKYPDKEFPGWLRPIRLLLIDALNALDRKDAISVRQQVLEFHREVGQPIGGEPAVPSQERVLLRVNLIAEEFLEMVEATLNDPSGLEEVRTKLFALIDDPLRGSIGARLPDFVDALADIDYVVEGSRIEFGVDGGPIAAEVHRANMTKANGPMRPDGKRLKPEGFRPPDVEGELRKQGWKG